MMRPVSSTISARVPPVPTSIPRTCEGTVPSLEVRGKYDPTTIEAPFECSWRCWGCANSFTVYVNGGIVPRTFWIASSSLSSGGQRDDVFSIPVGIPASGGDNYRDTLRCFPAQGPEYLALSGPESAYRATSG